MQTERRWLLSIVMSVMLAVTMFNPVCVMAANRDGDSGESGDETITFVNSDGTEIEALLTDDGFIYEEVNSDGTEMIKIIGYIGGGSVIDVPTKINGAKVMSFAIDPNNPGVEGTSYDSILKIKLPKYLEYAHPRFLGDFGNLKAVSIAEGNELFKSEGGVLFRKLEDNEGYRIELYPTGKRDTEYVMPDYVTEPGRFNENSPIETLTFSANLDLTGCDIQYTFTRLDKLETIIVPEGNKTLSSADGVVFNKDKTELIFYPGAKDTKQYTVPSTVTTIKDDAFYYNPLLETLTLPEDIQSIEGSMCSCYHLTTVEFTGKNPPASPGEFRGLKGLLDDHEVKFTYPEDADADAYEAFIKELRLKYLAPIPAECESIALGEDKDIEITEPGEVVTLKFKPEETGYYYFKSMGECDTLGYVLTKDKFIDESDDVDDPETGALDSNFKVYFKGVAGDTYYLQVKIFEDEGTFKVCVDEGRPTLGYAPVPDNPLVLQLDTPQETVISEAGEVVTYSFTPEVLGEYCFESLGDYDTAGCVLTDDEFIQRSESSYDDEMTEYPRFAVDFYGYPGVTYYLQAKFDEYAPDETGSFDVLLSGTQMSFARIPNNPETIALDDVENVTVTEGGQVTTYAFTPEESGNYYYNINSETEVAIDGCAITKSEIVNINVHDDPYNSSLFVSLEAGTTYYFQTRYHDAATTGAYSVQITKEPEYECENPDLEKVDGTPATCEEAGTIDYWVCNNCYRMYSDAEGTIEISNDDIVIEALGHDLIKVPAKQATCEEPGNIAYWKCTRCKQLFRDREGYETVDEEDAIVPATGHAWGKGVISEGSCTEGGTITRTCEFCGETETEELPPADHIMKHFPASEPTCTKDGNLEYWKCKTCGQFFADAEGNTVTTEEAVTREAAGHNWSEWQTIETPTCQDEGLEVRTCDICGTTQTNGLDPDPEAHSWDGEYVIVDPTCGADGSKTAYCAICGIPLESETIPATGEHSWGAGTIVKESTCTEVGEMDYECEVCQQHKTGEIARKPHTLDGGTAATKATPTEPGNIAYWTCSECHKNFSDAAAENEVTDIAIACPAKYLFARVTYNGAAQKPALTVVDTNDRVIEAANYDVEYSNNVHAGKANAKVSFKGDKYTGSTGQTFTINKANQSMTVKAATKSLKVKKLKKKALTVAPITVKKQGGAVTYKKTSGSAKLTINASTGKVKVKKKTKKGTYKIKVKVTSAANANYNAASKTVTVTVKVKK